MKYIIFSTAFILLINTPVLAIIGETEEACSQRYGSPIKEEVIQGYDKKAYYNSSPYNLSILFKDGEAVIINYQMEDKSNMSLWRLEHILHDHGSAFMSGIRNVWYIDYKPDREWQIDFIDRDKNHAAFYNVKSNTLTIRSIKMTGP